MRIDRGLLGWGVFLIVLGAVPLAVRAGYLDTDTVRRAWELWPLILIGIGLGIVLQRTQAAVVGGLVVSITFGLMGGALLAVGISGGFPSFSGCGTGAGTGAGTPFATQTGTLGGEARVDLDLNCGELTLTTAPGNGWTVAGTGDRGQGPAITTSGDRLRVRSTERDGVGFNRQGDRWQVTLPDDPTIRLGVSINAGSGRFDMSAAHVPDITASVNAGSAFLDLAEAVSVGKVDASVNAGSMDIVLPAASLTGSLAVTAGSIDVCVPAGAALRFRGSDSPLLSNNFGDRGLVRNGQNWTSAGYDTAETRIDLSATGTAASITLNPEGGCD